MIILIEKQRDIKLFLHILVVALVKKSLRFETIITKCSRHIRKRWRWGSRVRLTLMFTLKRDVLLIIIILLQNVSHNSAGTEPGFTVTRSQSLPALLHWNSFLIRNELRDYYCCTTSLPPPFVYGYIFRYCEFSNIRKWSQWQNFPRWKAGIGNYIKHWTQFIPWMKRISIFITEYELSQPFFPWILLMLLITRP